MLFCVFHTFQINVSKRIKTNFALNFKFNFQLCVNIYSPTLLFRIVFSTFIKFLHPTLEYIYISQILIMTENKELYDAPTVTVVEIKQEGVICASPDPNYTPWDNLNW